MTTLSDEDAAQIRGALFTAYLAIAGQDDNDRALEGAELDQAQLSAMAACVNAAITLDEAGRSAVG